MIGLMVHLFCQSKNNFIFVRIKNGFIKQLKISKSGVRKQ